MLRHLKIFLNEVELDMYYVNHTEWRALFTVDLKNNVYSVNN